MATFCMAFVLALVGCGAKEKSQALASIYSNSAQNEAAGTPHGIFAFDLRPYPRDIRTKLLAEAAEGIACRATIHRGRQTIAACDRLLAIHKELVEKGWCLGPTSVSVGRRIWMRCGAEANSQN